MAFATMVTGWVHQVRVGSDPAVLLHSHLLMLVVVYQLLGVVFLSDTLTATLAGSH
jgi:hypothetical protein